MTFVDITIVPVADDRKAAYVDFSRRMAAVYCDHGATRVVDYWRTGTPADAEDFHGTGTSYDDGELQAISGVVGASPSESIVVTVMEWPSQEARDRGTAAAANDHRVTATLDEPPIFDGRRVVGDSFEITMDMPTPN